MTVPQPLLLLLLGGLPGPPASPGAPGGDAPVWLVVAPYAIIFLTFYFLLFAPTRKKQQKTQEMLAKLKAGDRVMLTCGIYGTIVSMNGDQVQLRIADKVKIDVAKSAVAGAAPEPAPREEKS